MHITVGQLIEELGRLPRELQVRFGAQHFVGITSRHEHVEIVLDPVVLNVNSDPDGLFYPPRGGGGQPAGGGGTPPFGGTPPE